MIPFKSSFVSYTTAYRHRHRHRHRLQVGTPEKMVDALRAECVDLQRQAPRKAADFRFPHGEGNVEDIGIHQTTFSRLKNIISISLR